VAALVAGGVGCSLFVDTSGLDTREAGVEAGHPADAGSGGHDAPADANQANDTNEVNDARDEKVRPHDAGADVTGDAFHDSGGPAAITLDVGFPKTAKIGNTTDKTLSTTFDLPAGGRLLAAVIVWGQYGGYAVWPAHVSGAGLKWTRRVQTISGPQFPTAVGVAVWTAWASTGFVGGTVTSTRNNNNSADALLAVYSFAGASMTPGASGTSNGFDDAAAPLSFTIDAMAAGSFIVGGLLDGNGTCGVRGSTLADTKYDVSLASGSGNGLAIGRLKGRTSMPGSVTLGQDTSFQFDVAAGLEILEK
jgi:hypothetical protein